MLWEVLYVCCWDVVGTAPNPLQCFTFNAEVNVDTFFNLGAATCESQNSTRASTVNLQRRWETEAEAPGRSGEKTERRSPIPTFDVRPLKSQVEAALQSLTSARERRYRELAENIIQATRVEGRSPSQSSIFRPEQSAFDLISHSPPRPAEARKSKASSIVDLRA